VEQRNYRFKKAVEQALLLRNSRDFNDRGEYEYFLQKLFVQLNAGREKRFLEDQAVLCRLPKNRIDSCKRGDKKVGPSSTIRVNHNTYSVESRLVGENIQTRLYMDRLEIWYGQKKIDTLPRLRGDGKYKINYRHIIDSLIRKPGAFKNYRYRDAMFPTIRFRVAYDSLKQRYTEKSAAKRYLNILNLAAKESEAAVDNALRIIIDENMDIDKEQVKIITQSEAADFAATDINIPDIDLTCYDRLLQGEMV